MFMLPKQRCPKRKLLFVYETDYEVGQDNVEIAGLDVHNPVFFLSAGLIVLFGDEPAVPGRRRNTLLPPRHGRSSAQTGCSR
jgi:hypothetical protein